MTVYSRRKLDNEWIDFIINEADEPIGSCYKCSKDLEEGDYRDGLAPYHTENNICKSCLNPKKLPVRSRFDVFLADFKASMDQ